MLEFVRALASDSPQSAAYWRARRRWNLWGCMWWGYIFLVYIAQFAYILWYAQHSHDWSTLMPDGGLSLINSLPILAQGLVTFGIGDAVRRPRFAGIAARVRQATLAGNDAIAPIIPIEAITTHDVAAAASADGQPSTLRDPATYGPFDSAAREDVLHLTFNVVMLIVIGLLMTADYGIIARGTPLSLNEGGFGALQALCLCAPFLLLAAIYQCVWLRRIRRPLWLVADKIGLRPAGAQPDDPRAIGWGEARAFVRIGPYFAFRSSRVFFLLDTGDRLLIWSGKVFASPAVAARHVQFCALVAARTGLPLRDLSRTFLLLSPFKSSAQLSADRSPSNRALAPFAPAQNRELPILIAIAVAILAPMFFILVVGTVVSF